MEIKTSKLPKSRIKFRIIATNLEVAHFFDMAIEHLSRELKMPGFRPGKVPVDVAKGALGEEAVIHEAQDIAINDAYLQLVTKENLVPIARPENVKINFFSETEGLDWEGEVDLLPEVKIEGWKEKLKSNSAKIVGANGRSPVQVEPKEIEDSFIGIKKQFAELEAKDGKTENGDWINIDFDIVDKERFDAELLKKFKANGFTLVIGEAGFIPGFEEELTGMEKGSEKEFDATFPANYHEKKLQGQKVRFKVKINEIKKVILPELDDKFAGNFGFATADELKKAVEADILNKKQANEKARFEDEVIRELISYAEIDIPRSLIEQEKDMITGRFVHDLEHHKGIQFSDYLMSLSKNEKEFREGFSEHAQFNVKTGLVIGQISKDEKIEVNEKDIEEVMSMDIINQTAGMPAEKSSDIEKQIKTKYQDDEFLSSIKNSIMARKAIDLIVEQVNNK